MEPIRVIGRIDLAQQVHAALLAEGADARLATAAPMAVVAETGRDGTVVDVLANGFELCSSIKQAAIGRPVVMVTFDEEGGAAPTADAYAAWLARTSRGPDAHLPWPATGAQILGACERAKGAARASRPRVSVRNVATTLVVLAAAAAWAGVFAFLPPARGSASTHVLLAGVQAAIFVALAWWSARRAPANATFLRRATPGLLILFAGLSLVHALVRALHG